MANTIKVALAAPGGILDVCNLVGSRLVIMPGVSSSSDCEEPRLEIGIYVVVCLVSAAVTTQHPEKEICVHMNHLSHDGINLIYKQSSIVCFYAESY